MKIDIVKPDTIQFVIRMDKGDELYHKCMWARVTFDNKNWSMTAQSDCGDYSYSWVVESGSRTFLELMAVIDKGYLLGKISSKSRFDLESTKSNIIDYIGGEDELTENQKEWLEEINVSNGQEFMREIDDCVWFDDCCDLWECVEYDYPYQAKTFADIFCDIIQPKIKEYLQTNPKANR